MKRPAVLVSVQFARRLALASLVLLALPAAFASDSPDTVVLQVAPSPSAPANAISVGEYEARLQSLDQLLANCQREMTPANCRSDQVGPDLQLALSGGSRQVRFAWLRELLSQAARNEAKEKQAKQEEAAKTAKQQAPAAPPNAAPAVPAPVVPASESRGPRFTPPTLAQQLEDARKRLAADGQAASQLAGKTAPKPSASSTAQSSPERKTLDRILAAREYHPAIAGPSPMQRLLEKVGNWIDTVLGKLSEAGFKSKWIGLAAEIAFVVALCVVVVWILIRLERQGRLGIALVRPGPGPGAASARDWQLWLEDARKAAAQGAWRDAIHLTYWASISRLESAGLWPADRARTPREYLALHSRQNGQRSELNQVLATLTRSFERTWYAGRPAAEADFREAEQLAAQLGARLGAR